MDGHKLAKFLMLMMVFDLLLFSPTEGKAWWRRRRRRPRCDSSRPVGVAWVNKWHEPFTRRCPINYSLAHWRSIHRNCKEDRIHYFRCRRVSWPARYSEGNCEWTSHYVNDFDGPVFFKCNNDGIITGVSSVYSGGARDRRFSFRCCRIPGYTTHNCKHTHYLNIWDGELKYTVPRGLYLIGVYSHHRNDKEDRRWEFEICKISKKGRKWKKA